MDKSFLLACIICILIFLVIFIILSFLDTNYFAFVNKQKKKLIFDIINSDYTTEKKYQTIKILFQKNGKCNNRKLHGFLLKNLNSANISLNEKSELIRYSEENVTIDSDIDILVNQIYLELNHNDVNNSLIKLEELKKKLVELKRKNGYEINYSKVISLLLAILTIISFFYNFF